MVESNFKDSESVRHSGMGFGNKHHSYFRVCNFLSVPVELGLARKSFPHKSSLIGEVGYYT